jgi:hypothetical protein
MHPLGVTAASEPDTQGTVTYFPLSPPTATD